MIFGSAVYNLGTAKGTTVNHNNRPTIGTIGVKFFTVEIFFHLGTFGRKLYFPFEAVSHCHKELVVGLKVIFPHLTYCHSAGKNSGSVNGKIGVKIHGISLVHQHFSGLVSFKHVTEEVGDYLVNFSRLFL